jgi:hypothetical protein
MVVIANPAKPSAHMGFSGIRGTKRLTVLSQHERYNYYVSAAPFADVAQIAMSIELNNPVSTTLIKVSILYFYRRMAHRLTNQFIYWVWGTMVFCIIYGILFIFLIIFTCTPLNGFFHYANIGWRLENKLTCRDKGAIIVACAIISTVRDFIICMLIWNLKISKRQKFGLCGIFGIGLITCVCGILRTYYATYFYYCKLI